ncbi:MAG: DUF4139 domain-containing protein [Acidobacteriota bacterium]|nr:MAG: DUF4139 domain-containing protein [Acidobacteriota bacterium]
MRLDGGVRGLCFGPAPLVWLLPLTMIANPHSAAVPDDAPSTALTIYSTARPGAISPEQYLGTAHAGRVPGVGIVKDERMIGLSKGVGVVRFTDVAAQIDPTTVSFESLTDPSGTRVREQSFQFDLVSADKLLERFVDQQITVERLRGHEVDAFTGTLLSTSGSLVLRGSDGRLRSLREFANIIYPELPGGLITRPTLVWDIDSARGGTQRVRVNYETKGLTWWADYNLVFRPGEDANSGLLDVGAWVSLLNQSGASYDNARLKLIAGDVHRAPAPGRPAYEDVPRLAAARAPEFEEKEFFEYHLYTLTRETTIPDNSTKQIELFEAAHGVPASKILLYDGAARFRGVFSEPMVDRGFGTQSSRKVDIYLRFENSRETGLGIPLPSGRIRVSQLDAADSSLEFIGEDVIDHTPRDESVLIRLGSAFDVVGERTQAGFRLEAPRRWMAETIEIKLRNHKSEPVEVLVVERLYRWSNWKLTEKTHDYEQIDARVIHFSLHVEPNEEQTIRYTVEYRW